jgi:hypothetical protein
MTTRLIKFGTALLALPISFTASGATLSADGKSVEYWAGPGAGVASFRFSMRGFTNTYRLDCASQQFLWVENRKDSSGRVTDNNRGAEWKQINPSSQIATAVYGAICPSVLSSTQQPTSSSPQPSYGASPPSPSGWTPNANQIRSALQRELDGRMARLDALADQCKKFQSNENPMSAMLCLASGGGMITSKTFNAKVNSVSVDECVLSDTGAAYCRYSADTTLSGSGLLGQMADFGNALSALGGWTYSSFVNHGGTWHFQKTYDSCSWGAGGINCRWTERR